MKVQTVISTLQPALVLDVQRSGLVPDVERSADSLVRDGTHVPPSQSEFWRLGFGASLEFGVWSLEFPPTRVPAKSVTAYSRRRTPPSRALSAFSLIEILITVGLLSFIILGLLLMFNQVQRAFRSSTTQADILEAGRAVADMLARELEEMT